MMPTQTCQQLPQPNLIARPNTLAVELVILMALALAVGIITERALAVASLGLAMVSSYLVARRIFHLIGIDRVSPNLSAALLTATALRVIWAAASYRYSIVNGSIEAPYMPWFDSAEWLDRSMLVALQGVSLTNFDSGHAAVIGYLFKIVGIDAIHAIAYNIFLSILNVALVGLLATYLFANSKIAYYSVWLAAAYPNLLIYDTLISKDPGTATASLLIFIAIARFVRLPHKRISAGVLFLCALVAIGLYRPLMLPIGLIFFVFLSDRISFGNKFLIILAGVAGVAGGIYVSSALFGFGMEGFEQVFATDYTSKWVEGGFDGGLVGSVFADYATWPLWKRVLMIPVTSALQYILPFNSLNLLTGGWTTTPKDVASAVQNTMWLSFFGPWWLFSVFNAFRLRQHTIFRRVAIFSGLVFAALSFTTAGTQPRYVEPIYALMIVATAFTFLEWRHSAIRKVDLKVFFAAYYLCGLAALAGIFIYKGVI